MVGLRAKTYSYLIDYGSEDKKAKGTRKYVIKKTPKLRNCLEAAWLESKVNSLEKNKVYVDSLEEFIKNS